MSFGRANDSALNKKIHTLWQNQEMLTRCVYVCLRVRESILGCSMFKLRRRQRILEIKAKRSPPMAISYGQAHSS